jgi:CRISPR-associated endonuclease/helicase Cas3
MSAEQSPPEWLARPSGAGGSAERLEPHLQAVAKLASKYAGKLGYTESGRALGLVHDGGKALEHFQEYLAGNRDRDGYNHSSPGAILLDSPLSIPVACHHTGLQKASVVANRLDEERDRDRVQDAIGNVRALLDGDVPDEIELPDDPTRLAFDLRLLHSTLIDADWTRVSRHEGTFGDPDRPSVDSLAEKIVAAQDEITDRSSQINRIRANIRRQCIRAASQAPGIFKASIPTGGGKTRALMEMALRHAAKHDLSRVIVLAPYVSILKQTAEVYRRIFGSDAILEHHGSAELKGASTREYAQATSRWDHPIVVSTFVQGLESLLHTSNSRIRKTHRYADSVVILDEIQNLPYHLRDTTIWMLEELARHGASVIASSATQIPMPGREVIDDPPELYRMMKRVEYRYDAESGELVERSPDELWDLAADCSMIVVNTTADARRVAKANPAAFHLSTKMTAAHRASVLGRIQTLSDSSSSGGREPVQLVATQVVEAGVDLDFDQVIRVQGPMDNVIQAGGRCNREGRRNLGEVLVTRLADGDSPPGAYQAGIDAHQEMLGIHGRMDLNDPRWLKRYYERMESRVSSSHPEIMAALERLDFPAAHDEYTLIENAKQVDVLVPHPEHGASQELVDRIRDGEVTAELLRETQPFTVSPYIWSVEEMVEDDRAALLREDFDLYLWTGSYDPRLGIS